MSKGRADESEPKTLEVSSGRDVETSVGSKMEDLSTTELGAAV